MDKQLTLYDITRASYKIKNKIRLIELFAGIGSQAKALKNLGADFETWKVVEFDKYAIASYNAGIQNKPKWGTMYFEKCDPVILTGMGSESDDREPGIRKTDVATTLLARDYKGLDNYGSNGVLQLVGQMDNSDGTHESQNRVYAPGGLAPTITTQSGGNLQPKTLECKAVGHIEHGTGKHQSNTVYSDSGLSPTLTTIENGGTQQIKVIGNYMPGEHEAGRVVDENGLCPTVKENHGTTTATVSGLRIRKLTPKECWKLMDFDDEDYDKAAKVNSQTQLYKQAGNSIVVSVLEAIIGEML